MFGNFVPAVLLAFLLLVGCFQQTWAQSTKYRGHPTDTLTSGGDNTRSGYMDNHNLGPELLKGGSFGVLWRKRLLGDYMGFNEQIYAQPLTFTPQDQKQRLYVISEQNYAYIMDAGDGTILKHRQLVIPFLTKDLEGCNDISDCVGSTSTGVIDPETGTWYVTTKTYSNQTKIGVAQGLKEGRYLVHALDTDTLESKPGFPIVLDGLQADNAPWRVFEGGKHNQRPALIHMGEWVYAGFGSHCVQWNFTGWVIGWHKQTGNIVAKFAMEGGRETTTGIGGGIWMSGGGIASDNPGRIYFATGNGYASQLADDPIPGRSPPTALEEAVVNMVINDDGSLVPVDFFMPWEKRDLDAMDKDLGTSGFVLLPPSVFTTPSGKRIGCVGSKTGKLYFLDLEDLGGYQMGPDRKDKVLQTIQMAAPIFSTAAAYPHEGGYLYVTPVGKQTVAYKFNVNSAGLPVFTQAGVTTHSSAGRQGVGHSTVTSNKGAPGSGILWIVDVEGINLRAYGTEPVDGILPALFLANNPGQSKFSRPTFGDGRLHLTTSTGYVTTFGSPVNMPLNCSAPYDAGSVVIGENSTTVVTCIAKIPLTVNSITLDSSTSPAQFSILNTSESLPKELLANQIYRFSISFKPTLVGPLSSSAIVQTTNRASGGELYSPTTPVLIRGVARSLQPILSIQPDVLSFGEIITGSNETSVLAFSLQNAGESPLSIGGYKWSSVGPDTPPFLTPSIGSGGSYTVGPFTFRGLPAPKGTIPGNGKSDVSVTFSPTQDGYFKAYLSITSNTTPSGAIKSLGAFGTAGGPPHAQFSWKKSDSNTWHPYNSTSPPLEFSPRPLFGTTTQPHILRLTNTGGTTLTLTISKPPTSGTLVALNGLGSLPEGSQILPNSSMDASLICSPPKNQVNTDPTQYTALWTFNTNDASMGKLAIQFLCTAISRQLGPPSSLTTPTSPRARYRYLGCYKDATPDRILDVRLYYSPATENAKCQRDCLARGYRYAATEYEGECWCGNTLPSTKWKAEETRCGYLCKGDYTQYCGGDGAYLSLFGDEDAAGGKPSSTTATVTRSVSSTLGSGPSQPTLSPSPWPVPENFTYQGCLLEPSNPPGARALSRAYFASDTAMTNLACTVFCERGGWALAGTEYGVECWCGNEVENGARYVVGGEAEERKRCGVECSGRRGGGEVCGGGNALSVWRRK